MTSTKDNQDIDPSIGYHMGYRLLLYTPWDPIILTTGMPILMMIYNQYHQQQQVEN